MELYADEEETVEERLIKLNKDFNKLLADYYDYAEEMEKYKQALNNLYSFAGARGECNTPEEYELRIKEGIVSKLR
jgi:hypothetical protein